MTSMAPSTEMLSVPQATPPQITSPTMLVKKEQCVANFRRMWEKSRGAKAILRPHCKTHASLKIARWLKEESSRSIDGESLNQITVSSLRMAEYFAGEWNDITVAFPVNILEMETINRLGCKLVKLNLVVENVEAINALSAGLSAEAAASIGLYIKVDVGYGRTGILATDFGQMEAVFECLRQSSLLSEKFLGFLAHAGHTYHCRGVNAAAQIREIHALAKTQMLKLKERYIGDYPRLKLSYGDTPSCSVLSAAELDCWDELRPGNFVFYDLEQAAIGSCEQSEIAVAVGCPIVATHQGRREITLYGGGVHCSKDRLGDEAEGTIFGRIARRQLRSNDDKLFGWDGVLEGVYLRSLSQEHGIVVVPTSYDMSSFRVGEILYVLPVHSCMTADCLKYKGYLTTDGENVERMKN